MSPLRKTAVASDLILCLPWMFLLLTVRTALPLDVAPVLSLAITFALLGAVGWAGPSRVVRAAARSLRDSDSLLLARAQGISGWGLRLRHLLPGLRPVLAAQFWTSIPLFILAGARPPRCWPPLVACICCSANRRRGK